MSRSLPHPASSMPGQSLTLRRAIMGLLCLVTWIGVGAVMARLLSTNGWTWADIGMLVCFLLSAPWTVLGFWNALFGFVISHFARDPVRLVNPLMTPADDAAPVTARVALTMFVRHEDIGPVLARLDLMRRALNATPYARQFHVFVLSDSQRPEESAVEEAAVMAWRATDPHPEEIIYRRREQNTGYKAGNMRDFCQRWGDRYDFMLPLDADSLMTADAILRLVRTMQANPQLGILQGLVVGMPADSFFARVFQFGMRHGMRTYTMGSAWWQGDCGPFWGHNALIRIAPFKADCHLPVLPGEPPLGGPILSHDQVEAVLMRRAGYEVRVLPEETGSWEVNPPALPDFVKRDLRWCQGNMQYWRLLGMPGLKLVSRIQLFLAIMMYIGAPAWMGFILFATAQGFLPVAGSEPFPAALGLGLFVGMLTMSLSPKLFGLLDLLVQRRERRRYGGAVRILGGGLVEFVFSTLLAPVVSFAETIFMIGLLFRQRIAWDGQQRAGYRVPWGLALRGLWGQTLFGLAITAATAYAAPGALAWAAPLFLSFVLAVPIAVVTSTQAMERAMRALRLCAIPEERDPAALVHRLPGAPPLLGYPGALPVAEPAGSLAAHPRDAA